jgi:NitT/TauT family transport system substrate-binding protein
MNSSWLDPQSKTAQGHGRLVKKSVVLSLVLAGLVALAACGSSSNSDTGSGGSGQTRWHASLRLDYTVEGFTVPEVVAEKKGFYAKRGLDLKVEEGSGSGVTTQQTGSGVATFGEADVSTAALYIAKGLPVKSVAVFLQTTPNGLAYRSDKVNITAPSDLQGKTLGLVQGEAPYQLLLAASKKNNISTDSYKKVFMAVTALPGALLSGRIDAMGAFNVGSFETTKLKNPDVKFTSFANWGVNVLSNGLLARDSTIKDNPEEVKALVDGTVEGWQWSLAHPDEAAAIAGKAFPTADPKALKAGLLDSKALLHTPDTQNMRLGATTPAQWTQTINFDTQYAGMKSDKAPTDYYTNQFAGGQ